MQVIFVAWWWFSHLLIIFVPLCLLSQVSKAPIILNSMPQKQVLYFSIFRTWKRQDTRKQNTLVYISTFIWEIKKRTSLWNLWFWQVLSPNKYKVISFIVLWGWFGFFFVWLLVVVCFINLWKRGFPETLMYYIRIINKEIYKYRNLNSDI